MANGRRRAALAAGVRWLLKVSLVVLAVGFLWRNSFGAPSALRRRRAGGAVRLHAAASSGSGGGAAGETAVYADDGGGDLAYDDPAAEAATPSLAAVAPARQQPAKPAAAAASASASAAESPTSSRTPAATSPAVAASPSPSGTRSREPPPPPSPASTPSPSPSGVPPATKTPRPTGTPSPSGVSATATAAVSASAPPRARSGAAFLPTVPPGWRPQPAVDVTPTSPQRHAYITMAAGNEAGRMAVALFQSIVSSGTSVADVDLVVLLPTSGIGSPECHDHRWKAARNRSHVRCDGSSPEPLIPEEVISPVYVDALRRLGAKLAVHAPLPQTPYTNGIPGGTQSSWGMSLNRLVAFNMTQYKKLVWMDSDVLVLKNMDHLFGPEYPTLTSSFTLACCSPNAPAIPGGGLWVFEPDARLGLRFWELMMEGQPVFDKQGYPVMDNATGTQAREVWRLSDMALVQAMFTEWPRDPYKYRLWPWVRDMRHGHAPGIRRLPEYAGMTDEQYERNVILDPQTGNLWAEGFRPELVAPDDAAGGVPVWHALPVSYDQCVSHCDCVPWRWPAADSGFAVSVHFSCLINGVEKPGRYASEAEFLGTMVAQGWSDCTKYYYLLWLDQLHKALGGPLLPAYNGTRPGVNMTVLTQRPTKPYPVKYTSR